MSCGNAVNKGIHFLKMQDGKYTATKELVAVK
jgi:hypothetical protein